MPFVKHAATHSATLAQAVTLHKRYRSRQQQAGFPTPPYPPVIKSIKPHNKIEGRKACYKRFIVFAAEASIT
jgi:hypothetical protein